MKKLLLSILSVFLSAGFASAQDLPVSPRNVVAAQTHTVRFEVGATITQSGFIDACPKMSVRFWQSGTADVTLSAALSTSLQPTVVLKPNPISLPIMESPAKTVY